MSSNPRFSVSVTEEMLETLQRIAERKHRSVSDIVREAIKQYMTTDYCNAYENSFLKALRDAVEVSYVNSVMADNAKLKRSMSYTNKQVNTLLILVAALMSDIMDNGTKLENVISKAMLLADKFDGSQIKPNDYYIDKAHRLVTIEDDYGCENP